MTTTLYHGAPCRVRTTEDPSTVIVTLPLGHADLGYAPGSEFYAHVDEVWTLR